METMIEAPPPGVAFPDFDLLTTDGKRVRRADFIGRRPLLLTFASLTCPMTAAAAQPLARLFERFGARTAFVTVYAREANPGDGLSQAADLDEKLNYAHYFQRRERVPWPVAVDTVAGEFHERMGAEPNGCYIMDRDGLVAFHAVWSGDEAAIGQALEAVERGERPRIQESRMLPARRRTLTAIVGLGALAVVGLAVAGWTRNKMA
jgi:hypothetical protein